MNTHTGGDSAAVTKAAQALGSLAPLLRLAAGGLQALALQVTSVSLLWTWVHRSPPAASGSKTQRLIAGKDGELVWLTKSTYVLREKTCCLQALPLHRATAKLGYVITALFSGLVEQGFCMPDATREGTWLADERVSTCRCPKHLPLTSPNQHIDWHRQGAHASDSIRFC